MSLPEIYEGREDKVLAPLSVKMAWGKNKSFLRTMNKDSLKHWVSENSMP